jgi:hypothetical protein
MHEPRERVLRDRRVADGREDRQVDREQQDQQHPDPEVGHGHPQARGERGDAVDPRAGPHPRHDADRDADDERDDEAESGE